MARYLGFTPEKSKPFYFLSYNSEDQHRVKDYAIAMSEKGFPLWYDEGIEVGSKWERIIAERIKDSDTLIMFLSKGIFNKNESYVHKEFEMARDYFDKTIIIVLLDNIDKKSVPIQYIGWWIEVTRLQCINAFEYSSVEACTEKIISATGYKVKNNITTNTSTNTNSNSTSIVTEKYDNGVYVGELLNGNRHGKGKYTWTDGGVYEGDWLNDKRTGKGKYTWADGEIYEGDFVDDKRTGKGVFSFSNGDVYEGDFINGKRTGKGKYTWANGDIYEGNFINDKRTGKGKFTWTSGDVYEGDWKNGNRNGKGKSIFISGNIYVGDFVDDKRNGKGKFTWSNGDVYEGDWLDGKHTGKGKYTWSNGSFYEGDFVDGKRTGRGFYISADRQIIQDGLWENDNFLG